MFPLPHATKLTLVAALTDGISATGVATSRDHALTLARAEMQERHAQAAYQLGTGIAGFGTGRRQATADKRAQNEAIERYAVDRWWFHGQHPQQSDPKDKNRVRRILHDIGRASDRTVRTGSLMPVNNTTIYFALSDDQNGLRLCFGFGTTLRRAVVELMQMEFAFDLLTFKIRANSTLTREETAQWDRAQNLGIDQISPLFTPTDPCCANVALRTEPLHNARGPLKVSCAQIAPTPPFTTTDSTPWRRWSPF